MTHTHRTSWLRTITVLLQMFGCAAGIYACFFGWGVLQERIATKHYEVDGKDAVFKYSFVIGMLGCFCSFILGSFVLLCRAIYRKFTRSEHHHLQHHHHQHHGDHPQSTATATSVPETTATAHATPAAPVLGGAPQLGTTSTVVEAPKASSWLADARLMLTVGITIAFGPPFGYAAMHHVPYPMVLTLKMCKMVPIVLVGVLWHRASYSKWKYMAMLYITGGVLAFSLLSPENSKKGGASADVLGAVYCFINLFFDGYTNSTQDAILKKNSDPFRLMTFANLSAGFIGICSLFAFEMLPPALHNDVLKPELFAALHFASKQPMVIMDLLKMGALGALGQLFIFQGMALFGSLTVVAITITRKIGSVFISILIHDHQLANEQWFALAAVVLGVVLDTYDNVTKKKHHHHEKKE